MPDSLSFRGADEVREPGIHMWTAPDSQGVGSLDGLVGCGHMSGPPLSRGQAFVVRSG